MNSRFTVLTLTTDIALVKNLQERTSSFISQFQFVPLSSGEKIGEYVTKFLPNAILLDDAYVDPMNGSLVAKLKQTVSAAAGSAKPFFALSAERGSEDLKKIIHNGIDDVFTKPIDPSMFFQKLQIHFPQQQFLKDKLLFSMDVNARIDLSLECKLEKASEYGATIRLNRALAPGDLFILHGKMFGALTGDCLGRVMSCTPRVGEGEKFEASLLFVAPKKEILSAIRLWIKQEYVHGREAKQ